MRGFMSNRRKTAQRYFANGSQKMLWVLMCSPTSKSLKIIVPKQPLVLEQFYYHGSPHPRIKRILLELLELPHNFIVLGISGDREKPDIGMALVPNSGWQSCTMYPGQKPPTAPSEMKTPGPEMISCRWWESRTQPLERRRCPVAQENSWWQCKGELQISLKPGQGHRRVADKLMRD